MANRMGWLRLATRWGLFSLTVVSAFNLAAVTVPADDNSASKPVRVVIDFGDGFQKHFTQLKWRDKMTVLDVMKQARDHRHGIRFEHRGQGATLLLTRIDDVKNEGASARNWIYRVNDKVGDRSIGIYPVEAGDAILWRFETYR